MTDDKSDPYSEEEIARRMDAAVRRALNTPPKPHKEMIGKTDRAKEQRKSRVKKVAQSNPKAP
jgi:hypothetical protein